MKHGKEYWYKCVFMGDTIREAVCQFLYKLIS